MSATTLTARGRARAEQEMVDACTIQRHSGFTTDAATLVVTETFAGTPIYVGKCKVNRVSGPSAQEVGEVHVAVLSPVLSVPMSVVGMAEGDLVTITASLDPELVGKRFRLQGPIHNTHQTARRFQCTEVT